MIKNILGKKIIIPLLFLFFVAIFVLIIFLLRKPSEQNIQAPSSFVSQAPTVPPTSIMKLGVVAHNLKWLNNQELAYTFYDSVSLETKIAFTADKKTPILINTGLKLKLPQFYWSDNNDLLILDTRYPNKTFLLAGRDLHTPHQLAFSGYSYSFSPDSQSIFYLSLDKNTAKAEIFNVNSNSNTAAFPQTPMFTNSFWSPNRDDIALVYANGEGTPTSSVYILNLPKNTVQKTPIQEARYIRWSPDGNAFFYTNSSGIFSFNPKSLENTAVYSTTSDQKYLSFAWVDKNTLLIFDPHGGSSEFYELNLSSKKASPVLANVQLSTNQYIEMALSLKKDFLAIATEKDGLMFVAFNQ